MTSDMQPQAQGAGMEPATGKMRFADTAPVVKHTDAVALVFVGTVVTLYLGGYLDWLWSMPVGFWEWLGWAVFIIICVLLFGALCYSREVVVDAATGRVTEWQRLLNYEVAKNEWGFADFTTVLVEQDTSREHVATSSPGSQGYKGALKTVYSRRYVLSLRRADTQTHHSLLGLPMEDRKDPLLVEAFARQLADLGGWPAKRAGYALMTRDEAKQASGRKLTQQYGHLDGWLPPDEALALVQAIGWGGILPAVDHAHSRGIHWLPVKTIFEISVLATGNSIRILPKI